MLLMIDSAGYITEREAVVEHYHEDKYHGGGDEIYINSNTIIGAMSNTDVMSDIGSNFGFGDDVYII
jgi:hypothetical protein